MSEAMVDSGRAFGANSGKWAGERFLAASAAGRDITPSELRTLDTLRRDEWIEYDTAIVEAGTVRLRGVADLIAAGLTRRITNGLAKTMLEWQKIGDISDATVSLDGNTRSENDQIEFELDGLPLPITHKDFYLNLRHLAASRSRGNEGIDTVQARFAGRKVGESLETTLFQGLTKKFGGRSVYGYTTHPDRNLHSFGTNGNWAQSAKTGENMFTDLQAMIAKAEADRFYGPYWVYVSTDGGPKLNEDWKANSDKSIRTRLLELDQIQGIRVADKLPTASVVLVQATDDVVQWVTGEPLQTVQWDVNGGFQLNFKAFTIAVPLIKSDSEGRSGIVHMS